MKTLTLMIFARALTCSLARADTSSPGSTPFAYDYRSSRNTNGAILMAVTATASTTTIPRCKGYEIQIVSGASVRFNSQGGPVTASSGGLKLTTDQTYSEENETTTRIRAIVTEGSAATLVIIPKY